MQHPINSINSETRKLNVLYEFTLHFRLYPYWPYMYICMCERLTLINRLYDDVLGCWQCRIIFVASINKQYSSLRLILNCLSVMHVSMWILCAGPSSIHVDRGIMSPIMMSIEPINAIGYLQISLETVNHYSTYTIGNRYSLWYFNY